MTLFTFRPYAPIQVGMTEAELLKAWGKPSDRTYFSDFGGWENLAWWRFPMRLASATIKRGRVSSFWVEGKVSYDQNR